MFPNLGANPLSNQSPALLKFLLPFAILDLVLKGFALWRSAQKKQTGWFLAILIVNSLGILPGIYLVINRGKKEKNK